MTNSTPPALARMKVAHLTTVDMTLELLLLPQLLAARAAGAEVIGISAPGPYVKNLQGHGIRHIPLQGSTRGVDPLGDFRAAVSLWRILRAERPDVLHTHNPKPGIYGRIIGRLAGVPRVVNTVHGLYAMPNDPLLKRLAVYALECIAAHFSDAELVQNEEDYQLLRRFRLVASRRLNYLGNGVDLTRFAPTTISDEKRHAIRSELGVDDDKVLVGIVARLVHEKGYRELIEAASASSPQIAFVAVGGVEHSKADRLTQAELQLGESSGIRFLGHREDVVELYAAMDVVVLPSYREGVPRSLIEAAAMGKALIATDIRGCRQVVTDGVNGRLVPVRAAGPLAATISQFANDPSIRRAFGESSRLIAERYFDEKLIIQKVLASYLPNPAISHKAPSAFEERHNDKSQSSRGAESTVDVLRYPTTLDDISGP